MDHAAEELAGEAEAPASAPTLRTTLRAFVCVFSPLMVLWALVASWLFPHLALRAWIQTAVCVGAGLLSWLLARGKHPRRAIWFALFTAWATAIVSAYTAGGVHSPAFATLPALVVVAGILLDWRAVAWMTVASIATGGVLTWAQLRGVLPTAAAIAHPLWSWLASCLLLAIIATLQFLSARLTRANVARIRAAQQKRRAAELQTRASEARYREIFDSAGVALFELDVSPLAELRRQYEDAHPGVDLRAQLELAPALADEITQRMLVRGGNDAALKLLELDDPQVLHNDCRTLFSPEHRPLVARMALDVGHVPSLQAELTLRTFKDHERHVIASARSPSSPAALDRVIVSALDVTETRALEARARAAERMETIGRVTGGVAHDFNNALVVIMSWADLLRKPGRSEAERAQGLDAIAESAARAAQLTRQLLSIGRRSLSTPRPTSVKAMLDEMVRALSRLCPADIEVQTRYDEDLLVLADEGRLLQVLLNLGLNARDAMPAGGVLTLSARRAPPDAASDLPPSSLGYAEISVTDTGIGMDQATLARVFEPFFTTKEGKGSGLGLATAHAIVTQSHGKISVSSIPGQGSRFDVLLPLTQQPSVPAAAPAGSEGLRAKGTVLVVDDEALVRQVMVQALQHAGYSVLAAQDGETALALARQQHGAIDLLCTDGILPGISARQVIDTFHELFPAGRVLVCSGHVEEELMRRRIAAGECEMLAKPFMPAELVRKAAELIGKKS